MDVLYMRTYIAKYECTINTYIYILPYTQSSTFQPVLYCIILSNNDKLKFKDYGRVILYHYRFQLNGEFQSILYHCWNLTGQHVHLWH